LVIANLRTDEIKIATLKHKEKKVTSSLCSEIPIAVKILFKKGISKICSGLTRTAKKGTTEPRVIISAKPEINIKKTRSPILNFQPLSRITQRRFIDWKELLVDNCIVFLK
tara:strand:+ start:120 stop:452 length:333 start_codon:yes stop_codon:yes gene_type:complete